MKLDAPEVTIFTNMPHTHASAAQGGPSTAPETVAATGKTTPVDADQLPLVDSAASNVLKKLTWANVKATLKTYFDTLYTNNTGTVTSVSAITLGTTGTNLSSTVATGTTTPVITLQVPDASAANRGALLATDWTTFNSKQAGGTYVTPTTLNNNSLAASVTTLTTSGTNTMSALGAGIATLSAAGVISSTATTGTAGGSVPLQTVGDWAGTPTFTSGAASGVTFSGRYVKTGVLVTLTGRFTMNKNTGVGSFTITGLPFAAVNGQQYYNGAAIGFVQGMGRAGKVLSAVVNINTTTLQFVLNDQATGSFVNLIDTDMPVGTAGCTFSVSYITT